MAKASRPEVGLKQAYEVQSPEENRALYEGWAPTYESGFIDYMGYVYHRTVADLFSAYWKTTAYWETTAHGGAVLDVGCGTGVVGAELRGLAISPVDGIDISPAMLEEAASKTAPDGETVFRQLMNADLTLPLGIDDGTYAGVISAGTFTHGHVGPEPLDELVRIAGDGALFAIGINAHHYKEHGFEAKFVALVAAGAISEPDLIDIAIYDETEGDHSNDRAYVAIFTKSLGPKSRQ